MNCLDYLGPKNQVKFVSQPYRFRPRELDQLNTLIDTRISGILQPEINRCQLELCDYPGFIDDISDYEEALYDEFECLLNGSISSEVNNGSSSDISTSAEQF